MELHISPIILTAVSYTHLAHGEECVTKETADRYLELVTGRSQHIPLQHLTHQAFFMGYEFYVNEEVLIPRQDTDCLLYTSLLIMTAGCHIKFQLCNVISGKS